MSSSLFSCLVFFFKLFVCTFIVLSQGVSGLSVRSGWQQTPFGTIPSHCIHTITSESTILVDSDNLVHVIGPDDSVFKPPVCEELLKFENNVESPQIYHGWQAWTTFEYPAGIDGFVGQFSIPNKPTREPGILYIFTGLQNINWIPEPNTPNPKQPFDIIQPVLEYTSGAYSVASWYVTLTQGYLKSTSIPCESGQHIFGNMTRLDGNNWLILSEIVETKKVTQITVNKPLLQIQPWAYTTLEVYEVTGCDQYPTNNIEFTNMILYANGTEIVPQWTANQGPDLVCHEQAVVNNPSSTTIEFGNNSTNIQSN